MATVLTCRLVALLVLSAPLGPLQGVSAGHQEQPVVGQRALADAGQTPPVDQQAPAVQQLWDLLGQTVGETVVKALADHYHHYHGEKKQQQQQQQQEQLPEAGNVSQQPSCQSRPEPLPDAFPFQDVFFDPQNRSCARSCLQLRDQGGSPQDGVYWFAGMPVPVICDFSHDGGCWTLLLTAVSKSWDLLSAKSRREDSPTMKDDYSMLRYADAIRDLGTGSRFAYRIEAQAETGRRRWGGVWLAPRHYSFVDETGSQTEVRLVRRFDLWTYGDRGIGWRMPWLKFEFRDNVVLTTSKTSGSRVWGTLASHRNAGGDYQHSPWIDEEATDSGNVLYWMREEEL